MSDTFHPDGVGVANGCYFGMPFTTGDAALALISVPWDVTVSYGAGTADAPDALIEASTQLDFYDELAPGQWRRGIATVPPDAALRARSSRLREEAVGVIRHLEAGGDPADAEVADRVRRINEGCAAMNAEVREQAARLLDAGLLVGLVGGDHSTPYGLIRALGERHASFGVLHIDAHCDLREAYEGFEFSHASIMYNVLRDVPQAVRITEVAVRDFSAGEAALAASSERIEQFSDMQLAEAEFRGEPWCETCRRIVATLPQEVYVSFDIDGLEIACCPHTGTPVPGGLTFNKALFLLDAVVRSGRRIIGFDVVEVAVREGEATDAAVGARILWKLCGQTLRSNSPTNDTEA